MLRSTPLRLKLLVALVLPMMVVGGYLFVDVTSALAQRDVAAAQRAEVDAFHAVSDVASAVGIEHLVMNSGVSDAEQLAVMRNATDDAFASLSGGDVQLDDARRSAIAGHRETLLALRETLGDDPVATRAAIAAELQTGDGPDGPTSRAMAAFADLPLDVLTAFEFDPAAIADVATSSLVDDDALVQRARADVRREVSTLLGVATLPAELVDAEVTESVRAALAETDEGLEALAHLTGIDLAGDLPRVGATDAWAAYDEFRQELDDLQVGSAADVDEAELRAAAADVDRELQLESDLITAELERRAGDSVVAANKDVVVSALIGLWLVVCVSLLLRFLYRAIKRPLERLTEQANHVARVELPTVIDKMRTGEIDDVPEIERIPVETTDEVGSLVRAFNDMHRSAVELAAGQAASRRVVADMFVNLGRRNQRLVSRMLHGLSELERDEQDPDRLAALYDLDHAATRMRRNAESLLVLAGASQARRLDEPVSIHDIARAAIGEVEGYQRVTIDVNGEHRVDGRAVSDVTHLLAELVENALNFSPPNSVVEIVAGRTSTGYVVAVTDNGIGMLPEQIDEANCRIAGAGEVHETPSDFLGHYVVGRLAARHDITVVLAEGPAGGVTARVWLPAPLLLEDDQPAPAGAVPSSRPQPAEMDPHLELPRPAPVVPDQVEPVPAAVSPEPFVATTPTSAGGTTTPSYAAEFRLPPLGDSSHRPVGGTSPVDALHAEHTPAPAPLPTFSTTSSPTAETPAPLSPGIEPVAPQPTIEPAAPQPTIEPTAPQPASAPASFAAAPSSEPAPLASPAAPAAPAPVSFPSATSACPSVTTETTVRMLSSESATQRSASAGPVAETVADGTPTPAVGPEELFGVPRRTPGAHLPRTELVGAFAGAMGSFSSSATAPTVPAADPGAPGSPAPHTSHAEAPTAAAAPSDPGDVRSALSSFQLGITRADQERSPW